jgi:hypothetical protein
VAAPGGCYFADPFLVRFEGRRALLVERFDYRICKGDLCAVPLTDDLQAGVPQPILPRRHHASFPYTFMHDRQLYLVPETCQDRTIEIHVCESFPDRWRHVRTVLEDIDAADTVIFLRDGLWWLVTAVRDDSGERHLAVWFARDVLGDWQAHPVNAQKLYHGRPCSSGRNGGAMIEAPDGLLLRPAQESRHFYGEGLRLMQVEALTPTEYRERAYDGPHPAQDIVRTWSPHHLSVDGDLIAFDIRDRARGVEGLWAFALPRRPRPDGDIPIPCAHAKIAGREAGP